MMYGKKSKVTPPMPLPPRRKVMPGDVNEAGGNPMRVAPVTPPARSPRRKQGHNTMLGKYASND